MKYQQKYEYYKKRYNALKNQIGGEISDIELVMELKSELHNELQKNMNQNVKVYNNVFQMTEELSDQRLDADEFLSSLEKKVNLKIESLSKIWTMLTFNSTSQDIPQSSFDKVSSDKEAYFDVLELINKFEKEVIKRKRVESQKRMTQRNERLRLGQQDDDVSIGEFRRLESQFAEQNRIDKRLNQRLDFLSSEFSVQQNERNAVLRKKQQRERQNKQRQERSREGEELRRYEEYGKTRRY